MNVSAARLGAVGVQPRSSFEAQAPKRRLPRATEQRETAQLELGRQVTVDLQADADFDESRGGPGHDLFPYCADGCRNHRS